MVSHGQCWSIAAALALPNAGGFAGSFVVRKNLTPWYAGLKKPEWRPPNWAFGPVWTALYTGMGYASYLVYTSGGGINGSAKIPLMLYGGQLALNWAWSPIFFGAHKIKLALYEILALDAAAAATAVAFYNINPTAGLLMIPYLLWLGLATALTFTIHKNNPELEHQD